MCTEQILILIGFFFFFKYIMDSELYSWGLNKEGMHIFLLWYTWSWISYE